MLISEDETSITGAMLCNAIASFVASFADSNGNYFLVIATFPLNVPAIGVLIKCCSSIKIAVK